MKCKLCKRMTRDNKSNICSKCRGKTLRELIKDNLINPEVFNNTVPTDKKGKVLALRNLTADTKQIRGSTIGENMSEDADNESVGKPPLTKTTLDVVSRIDGGDVG